MIQGKGIRYHCALNKKGELVSIKTISKDNKDKEYYCLSCGREMIAVLGRKKEHHFRHKGDSCETDLHILGKKIIKYRFDNYDKFFVSFYSKRKKCDKSNDCQFMQKGQCNVDDINVRREIDLKEYYDTCEEEAEYNGFIADLKLSSKINPKRKPIFIEIAVTHKCDEKKLNSDIRIIEIYPVSDMDFFYPLEESKEGQQTTRAYPDHIQQRRIKFHNFKREHEIEYSYLDFFCLKKVENSYEPFCFSKQLKCSDNIELPICEDTIYELVLHHGTGDVLEVGLRRALFEEFRCRKIYLCVFCKHHNNPCKKGKGIGYKPCKQYFPNYKMGEKGKLNGGIEWKK